MINLIPKEEKKIMVKIFYYKLLVLFFVMLDFIILIALISILPAYFFSSVKLNVVNDRLEIQQQSPIVNINQANIDLAQEIDKQLKQIKFLQKEQFFVSEKVIALVVSKKTPDIKITSISYSKNKENKVNISGQASSREALIEFRRSFEEEKDLFSKVDLPISNFLKGLDIEFNLSLILKTEQP